MTFKPRKIPKLSLEAPLERRWDVMGDEEAKRLHAQRQDEARRFSWRGPRTKQRALRCFVLTPLGFMTLGWAFVGGNPRTALAFLVAGVLLGALTFALRPVDYLSGLVYGVCGLVASFLAGKPHLLFGLLVAMLCGCIGIAQGRVEALRRLDQED